MFTTPCAVYNCTLLFFQYKYIWNVLSVDVSIDYKLEVANASYVFMTEGMVSQGVAITTLDVNPHRNAKCLR